MMPALALSALLAAQPVVKPCAGNHFCYVKFPDDDLVWTKGVGPEYLYIPDWCTQVAPHVFACEHTITLPSPHKDKP